MPPAGEQEPNVAAAVAVKPPKFSPDTAASFFTILEAQFALAKITTQDTKFYHAIAALPPTAVQLIPRAVLENKSYDELTKNIRTRYEKSQPQLFEDLVRSTPISGKPTDLMQNLRTLADKLSCALPDDLIRHQFFKLVDPKLIPALLAHKAATLDELATLGDQIMALLPPCDSYAAAVTSPPRASHQPPSHQQPSPQPPSQTWKNTEVDPSTTLPYGLRSFRRRTTYQDLPLPHLLRKRREAVHPLVCLA